MPLFQTSKQKNKNMVIESQFMVFVTPLPYDIQDEDLRFLFSLFGQVTKVKIINKSILQNYSYAFVYFDTLEAKRKAIKFCNGKMFGWKMLKVQNVKKNQDLNKLKYDFHNETFYQEEQSSNYESKPKKMVHLNQKSKNVDLTFGHINSKNISNSSKSPFRNEKSVGRSQTKEKDKTFFKVQGSSKKFKNQSQKRSSKIFTNQKRQDPQDIDY